MVATATVLALAAEGPWCVFSLVVLDSLGDRGRSINGPEPIVGLSVNTSS